MNYRYRLRHKSFSEFINTPMLARLSQDLNKIRLALLVAILFTGLAAVALQSPPMVFMAALLWSAPFVSVLVGIAASRGLVVTRIVPDAGTVGDIISGEVTVENRSAWPSFLVHLRSGEATTGTEDDAAHPPSVIEATTPSHLPIMALGGDEHVAPLLRPGTRMAWRQYWKLQRRGVYELAPARAGAVDPLGLSSRLKAVGKPQSITILPRPVKVDRLFFTGSANAGQQAPRYAAAIANAMDFHGVRPWQPGEAIRRIHWKSTARTGKLHLVEWEEDTAADVTVLLDTQAATIAGAAEDTTLETAITLTASIAAYLLENGYQFQLFYWEESTGSDDPQESSILSHLLPHQAAEKASRHPAQVRHYEARNIKNLGDTLRALAEIKPVHDPTATLTHLAQSSLPHIPSGRSTLLIASTLADIDGALKILAGTTPGGVSSHAIALDAANFNAPVASTMPTTTDSDLPLSHKFTVQAGDRVRLVRRSDAVATVLDQLL